MQDRPNLDEMLSAVEHFLRADVLPGAAGRPRYHLLVALNLLAIARRELDAEPAHQRREWNGLRELGRVSHDPADYASALRFANERLGTAIRAGEFDSGAERAELLAHLRRVLADKLHVANPAFLQRVLAEGRA